MIKGLDIFRKHFKGFEDNYILIGGTACWLHLEDAGFIARATKDFDLIIISKNLTVEFAKHFWEFIRSGGYEVWINNKDNNTCLYRFIEPKNSRYPNIIELMSKAADVLEKAKPTRISPLMIDKERISLSAIILDGEYYELVMNHSLLKYGISIADEVCLIPLKAKAWLNLKRDKKEGMHVNGNDIKKHRSDVFRMSQLIKIEPLMGISDSVKSDMKKFLSEVDVTGIPLKAWNIYGTNSSEIIKTIKLVYCS